MYAASITAGALIGYVVLIVCLLACVVWTVLAALSREAGYALGGVAAAVAVLGLWWWGMAFTTSSDYHSWTVKEGKVERVAKRLIATDNGMAERYVVTMNGEPYGIDDTRATLLKAGDRVSLRCKKDYQWGVPRAAHGWACRWNGAGQ